jgi:hypothetical protein
MRNPVCAHKGTHAPNDDHPEAHALQPASHVEAVAQYPAPQAQAHVESVAEGVPTHASSDGHPKTATQLHPTHVDLVISRQLQSTGLEPQQQYSGEPTPHSTLSTTNQEPYATHSPVIVYSVSYNHNKKTVSAAGGGKRVILSVTAPEHGTTV